MCHNKQGKHGFHYKKEKNGVTKNIDINIVSYLISMARSRVPTIVEIETEIDIPLTSDLHFPRPTFIPIWNSLPDDIKATGSHKVFKRQCKDKFLESYPTSVDCDIPHCEYCVD